MEPAILALLVGTGLVAGFISTLYGIGGGVLMVPVLHYGLGVDFRLATAVSLGVIAIQSPWGFYQHVRRGVVVWPLAMPLIATGIVGVLAGIALQPRLDTTTLKVLLAAAMVLAALRLVLGTVTLRSKPPGFVFLGVLGAVAGLASRLLGIGGGLVTVPVMALAGVPMHNAVASSLAPVFTNAALAAAVSLGQGVDFTMALPLALGALFGAPLGARAAHALADKGLRRVFAAGLVVAALWIILNAA